MSKAMSIATSLGPSGGTAPPTACRAVEFFNRMHADANGCEKHAGCDDTDSVQSQIVWCNVDTEVLSKNFVRLNSSCSPNFVAPGLSALIHSREARAPRLSLDGSNERQPTDGDRRPSTSGVTVENAQVEGGGPPPSLPDADGIRKKTGDYVSSCVYSFCRPWSGYV